MKRFLFVCVVSALMAGCWRVPGDSAVDRPGSVQTVGEGGPARLTLGVKPTELTTAERIAVTLEVRLDAGNEIVEPDLSSLLPEGLSIVDSGMERRAGKDGAAIVERRWVLDPFLAGEYEIGSLEVVVRKVSGDATAAPVSRISTSPVRVVVRSVLTGGEADLAGAKSIVDAPPEPLNWVLIVLFGVLVSALVVLAVLRLMRPKPPPPPVYVPAHELALGRLRALMSRRLVEAGRSKEFYEEASLILRRYIEDRFGLHAPERTTEEFLEECRSFAVLAQDEVAVLKQFLSHCDLVKFAAVIPGERDAEAVAATVREFVERTRDAGRLIEVGASGEVAG